MTLLSAWSAPYPISANRYWRKTKQGRIYVSKEAQYYKNSFVLDAAILEIGKSYSATYYDVSVYLEINPKLNKDGSQCKTIIDLDNAIKIAVDALNGRAYNDDKQIKKITAEFGQPVNGGGLSVSVYKFGAKNGI